MPPDPTARASSVTFTSRRPLAVLRWPPRSGFSEGVYVVPRFELPAQLPPRGISGTSSAGSEWRKLADVPGRCPSPHVQGSRPLRASQPARGTRLRRLTRPPRRQERTYRGWARHGEGRPPSGRPSACAGAGRPPEGSSMISTPALSASAERFLGALRNVFRVEVRARKCDTGVA